MKKMIVLVLVLAGCLSVCATNYLPYNDSRNNKEKTETTVNETWEFYSNTPQFSTEALAQASNYKFGQEAGCLYDEFMKMYVVREEVVPGDPTRRTVIRKPAIYNAVRSIEKNLNKELKNSGMTPEQAGTEFAWVLKVALAAFDLENESFEDALQNHRKDAASLLSIFNEVKLIEL